MAALLNELEPDVTSCPAPLSLESDSDSSRSVEDTKKKMEDAAKSLIMEAACNSALTGVHLQHGGPFGACIVRNGIFISMAHNTVLLDGDPTCHAEMNAIRYACKALDTHDLSDCELYTTCEPCPMCLGAVSWCRLKKVYTGVDRYTAASFGFDDEVFYTELSAHSGHWAVTPVNEESPRGNNSRTIRIGRTQPHVQPSMLNMYWGIEKERIRAIMSDPELNRTFRRRMGEKSIGFRGDDVERFGHDVSAEPGVRLAQDNDSEGEDSSKPCALPSSETTARYMQILEEAIRDACAGGTNKEREVFASCVVGPDGDVLAVAVNEVLKRRDSTATCEVLAIRKAAKKLKTYCLDGCSMYSTVEPCVMSLGAILWSRIENLYYGLSQNAAARYGFEEGLLHYRELFADPDIVQRIMNTETKVGFDACENVFKKWSKVNGVIY